MRRPQTSPPAELAPPPDASMLRAAISADYLADEAAILAKLIPEARLDANQARAVERTARKLVEGVRAGRRIAGGVDALLHEYDLSSEEGVVLMCLAEALLRIPDAETRDELIRQKVGAADWERHLGKSESLFVNASTWGLLLTGRVVRMDNARGDGANKFLRRLVARSGEPVIRRAITQAVRIIGRQFVLGQTIEEALATAAAAEQAGYRHSYDMLGEAARTTPDALAYLDSYLGAVKAVSAAAKSGSVFAASSISVKLSALHPRYEYQKRERIMSELVPRVLSLAEAAKAGGIGLTLDAEEADRLDLMLDVFEMLAGAPTLSGWNGLGLAVQAYQKRALAALDFLGDLAAHSGRRLPLRLVKGAYWDTEIKRAQVAGLSGYPVFTRKISTDTSYLACAHVLLRRRDHFFPQFATHNAHSIATIMTLAGDDRDFEFQRLHGMGIALYDQIVGIGAKGYPVRTYAPVGGHEHLLAYLVRRLLENGANTSFVNRLADDEAPIGDIIADPVAAIDKIADKPHPRIPPPTDLFEPERRNSTGVLLSDPTKSTPLLEGMREALKESFSARPTISGFPRNGEHRDVRDPSARHRIGLVSDATERDIADAFAAATSAQADWDRRGGAGRAAILDAAADMFEAERAKLMALIVREGGRTGANAQSELREAIDFLRYYGIQAREKFESPRVLKGPTGEHNELSLHGRGVVACISPWNFPLSIFTGQVSAALAAGNTVLAKPAEQTPLIAALAVSLLHRAGVPPDALHLLPGDGKVGAKIIEHPRLAGIAFTGSTATANAIRAALAAKGGPIIPFIAETGGINAMIVDSTALIEQAVGDAITSAFDSAGQRCSAARLLCVQEDIAARFFEMLAGAMDELAIGDPLDLATDVGPVIDAEALAGLKHHVERLHGGARLIRALDVPPRLAQNGTFLAPVAFEIDDIDDLNEEIFGPVLVAVRFKRADLDRICDKIAAKGYGLTLGIHSRLEETHERIISRLRAGNTYINRNQIGAVVGVQPFGGLGLSGTGPKSGGPHMLEALAIELSVSIDTTAAGGNAALLMLKED